MSRLPRGFQKSLDELRVLDTGRRLDTTGRIDPPRLNRLDRLTYIFGSQTTGEDQRRPMGAVVDSGNLIPGERSARSSEFSLDARIEQTGLERHTEFAAAIELSSEIRNFLNRDTPRPDEFRSRIESNQLSEKLGSFIPVQLDDPDAGRIQNRFDFVHGMVHKQSDGRRRSGEILDNLGGSLHADRAGRRYVKIESDRVST